MTRGAEFCTEIHSDTRSLTPRQLEDVDAWWRAANSLSVGQIFLMDNPLLREPLRPEHIKPWMLGRWGSTPGLNFIYAHTNRAVVARDLNMIYVLGPGNGRPEPVASAWLEGTYSEVYSEVSCDEAGMKRLFTQFFFSGGIPSHVAPETLGSLNEGGGLGYPLSHAYGAMFDNPDLIVNKRIEHRQYIRTRGEGMPEITEWRWSDPTATEPA